MIKKNKKVALETVSKNIDQLTKTVDTLASMNKNGFDDVEKKREAMEERLNKRLDRIEFHMNTHERRIEILEDKMLIVSNKLGLRR